MGEKMKKKVSANEMHRRQKQSQGGEIYCYGAGGIVKMKKSTRVNEIILDDLIWETIQTPLSRRSPLPH
ncbi:TPA: hypothetical protein ACYR7K_003144 [Morganella morganii]|uniref:hypothetical protein n=1 Tax=Morganella morganii TaxID=582 RepID=UPI000F8281BF|nr:hypothetical protein [Morganella morganii]RTY35204.1 hypothetical protein EKS33_01695 [Morganella morganii subsp. morganii]HEI8864322.1 hypothetical protein [Morganella morganii]